MLLRFHLCAQAAAQRQLVLNFRVDISAFVMNIPILKELERLKINHATAKVKSAAFQPDENDQKELIIKNGQRKEEEKRLMELRLKEADERLKDAQKLKNQVNAESPEDSVRQDRAQTAPSLSTSGKLTRSKSFVFSVQEERPQTAGFDEVLKKASGHFTEDLKQQVDHQSKDSKKIFESVLAHFKTGGVGCQFSVKRDFEVVDINAVLAANSVHPASRSMVKLEDMHSMKKKDGIALLFDPTIDTGGSVVKIRIYFQKAIDLVTEESCSRDYSFHSNGNYFGLELTDESSCVSQSTKSGAFGGGDSPLQSTSPLGQLSPLSQRSPAGSPVPPLGSTPTKKMQFTAAEDAIITSTGSPSKKGGFKSISNNQSSKTNNGGEIGEKRKGSSLPGWQGRPPIYIPSARCSIEVLRSHDPAAVASKAAPSAGADASTAYNLSKLRLFAVAAPSARAAVKKLHEFCNDFFVSHTANLTVAGGISALNLAALHGNLEGVKQLVESGANINARSRESKNHTALHEAVIGGHKDVAQYLLEMGANQLLRDEIGFSPLHHACKLESIALARVLIDSESGKRALLLHNNSDQKPIELCTSNFMKIRIEGAMRKLKIFVKPRVSILER